MSAVWLPDVLSDAFRGERGFQVDVMSGWRTRSARSTLFQPRGVMNHHTGSAASYNNILNYLATGGSSPPWSQVATSRPMSINGITTVRVTIVCANRANHAGKGHWSWTGTDGGNRYTIGIENHNSGSQAWPQQQKEAIWVSTAAILTYLRQNSSRAIDHKDYAPGRKVDRHSTSRTIEQGVIQRYLDRGVTEEPQMPKFPTSWKWARDNNISTVHTQPGTNVDTDTLFEFLYRARNVFGSSLSSAQLAAVTHAAAIKAEMDWFSTNPDANGDVRPSTPRYVRETINLLRSGGTGSSSGGMTQTQADARYVRRGTTIQLP